MSALTLTLSVCWLLSLDDLDNQVVLSSCRTLLLLAEGQAEILILLQCLVNCYFHSGSPKGWVRCPCGVPEQSTKYIETCVQAMRSKLSFQLTLQVAGESLAKVHTDLGNAAVVCNILDVRNKATYICAMHLNAIKASVYGIAGCLPEDAHHLQHARYCVSAGRYCVSVGRYACQCWKVLCQCWKVPCQCRKVPCQCWKVLCQCWKVLCQCCRGSSSRRGSAASDSQTR